MITMIIIIISASYQLSQFCILKLSPASSAEVQKIPASQLGELMMDDFIAATGNQKLF